MFVRVRQPVPTATERRAALYRCRVVLGVFAASVLATLGALLWIQLTPGMLLPEVHTRGPALLVALAFVLVVQGGGVRICYRDELRQQRRG